MKYVWIYEEHFYRKVLPCCTIAHYFSEGIRFL